MKQLKLLLIGLMLAAAMSLAACGGGGGGSSSGGGGNGGGGNGGGGNGGGGGSIVFNMVELAGFGDGFSAGIAINDGGLAVGVAADGASVKGAKWTVTSGIDTAPATPLNPLAGNNYSAAYGVNADGVAVGESGAIIETVADANTVAVYWPAGASAPVALSTVGLLPGGTSAAFAINEGGEIVGEAVIDEAGNTEAVYWASITADPLLLGTLNGGDFSSAYFIGTDGRIVGESQNGAGRTQGVVWTPAAGSGFQAPTALSAVANQVSSVAYGVDLNGRIVGEAELTSGVVQGVIWNAGGSVAGSLGANTSAQAINDADRIAGFNAALSGNDRAAVWNAANVADIVNLSTLFSQAYGINDSNQIVGFEDGLGFVAVPQ